MAEKVAAPLVTPSVDDKVTTKQIKAASLECGDCCFMIERICKQIGISLEKQKIILLLFGVFSTNQKKDPNMYVLSCKICLFAKEKYCVAKKV